MIKLMEVKKNMPNILLESDKYIPLSVKLNENTGNGNLVYSFWNEDGSFFEMGFDLAEKHLNYFTLVVLNSVKRSEFKIENIYLIETGEPIFDLPGEILEDKYLITKEVNQKYDVYLLINKIIIIIYSSEIYRIVRCKNIVFMFDSSCIFLGLVIEINDNIFKNIGYNLG